MKLIKTQEHTQLIQIQEHTELIQTQGQAKFCFLPEFETKGITYKSKGEVFGGLYFDFWKGQKQLKTSYFIGACWLEEKQLALDGTDLRLLLPLYLLSFPSEIIFICVASLFASEYIRVMRR
jgi:hypothetical protein